MMMDLLNIKLQFHLISSCIGKNENQIKMCLCTNEADVYEQ